LAQTLPSQGSTRCKFIPPLSDGSGHGAFFLTAEVQLEIMVIRHQNYEGRQLTECRLNCHF
jgi:hypothetical protein